VQAREQQADEHEFSFCVVVVDPTGHVVNPHFTAHVDGCGVRTGSSSAARDDANAEMEAMALWFGSMQAK
jgi:hypothetical protein